MRNQYADDCFRCKKPVKEGDGFFQRLGGRWVVRCQECVGLGNLVIRVICPYCKKEAPWVENKEKYGKNYGKSYMCYYCKECDAYVGCHNNTRNPLGTMANKELREWRMKCHALIDPLWKYGKMTRSQMYRMLRKKFRTEVHVGESDLEMCIEIVAMFWDEAYD